MPEEAQNQYMNFYGKKVETYSELKKVLGDRKICKFNFYKTSQLNNELSYIVSIARENSGIFCRILELDVTEEEKLLYECSEEYYNQAELEALFLLAAPLLFINKRKYKTSIKKILRDKK